MANISLDIGVKTQHVKISNPILKRYRVYLESRFSFYFEF